MSQREVLLEFATHISLATLLFFLIYAPAIALNVLVLQLEHCEVSPSVIFAIQLAEWAIIVADSTLFFAFLVKTTWRTIKNL